MQQVIEAIYENGIFRPLNQPELVEGQSVQLVVQSKPSLSPTQILELAAGVYQGLSEEEIDAIEAIALDRQNFFQGQQENLITLLDILIDQVGEDENHSLAAMMGVIGVLIEKYEDEHIPELNLDDECSPEELADMKAARADYEAGEYITFEQYKAEQAAHSAYETGDYITVDQLIEQLDEERA